MMVQSMDVEADPCEDFYRFACGGWMVGNMIIIIITRPWPASGRHGLAGSSGGDQSGRINSSQSIIEELARFARSDWMGSSGGDQSGRINSSHSIIEELACFACSDWMGSSGGDQQPIQKFSQNVTDAGSSTAYSEIQSKRH